MTVSNEMRGRGRTGPSLLLTAFLWLSGTSMVVGAATLPSQPNILFILVDDLGYGDLRITGARDVQTPHMDRLFSGGLVFNHFYANSSVCSPSRAAFLTGRYPDQVGVPGVIRQEKKRSWGHLSERTVLLPERLRLVGYQTAIIGKWHLGLESPNIPNDRGFDFFKGFLGGMMHDYWDHNEDGEYWMRENRMEITPEKIHSTELFTQWATHYLTDRDTDKPFFLFLSYMAPHAPIQPPQEWIDRVVKRRLPLDDKRIRYVAFIEHLDHAIGRVVAALEDQALLENTLIVITSDNGGALSYGSSNGALRGEKTMMYEGGIKVPCAFHWQGTLDPGKRTDAMAMIMDLFPTFCELAGVEATGSIAGRSLVEVMASPDQPQQDRTLFWVRRDDRRTGGQAHYAARHQNFKLVQNTPFEPYQLFDLNEDPRESSPIADTRHPMYRKLQRELIQHIRRSGAVPWQKPALPGNED